MAYENKEGFGALFKNDKKDNPKAPDYKGNIMLSGNLFELAGWKKEGKYGTFLSISGKVQAPKQSAPAASAPAKPDTDYGKSGFDNFDDDIPF